MNESTKMAIVCHREKRLRWRLRSLLDFGTEGWRVRSVWCKMVMAALTLNGAAATGLKRSA